MVWRRGVLKKPVPAQRSSDFWHRLLPHSPSSRMSPVVASAAAASSLTWLPQPDLLGLYLAR